MSALYPRDLLVHLREWLTGHQQVHTRHFGESDQSGHPHGYAGVVIPDWDLRQRLDEIRESLDAAHWQPIETAPRDQRVLIGWFELPGQDSMTVAFWHSTRKAWCNTWMAFSSDQDQQPTHWMPLP